MTTRHTKILSCRIDVDIYDSFALIAKSKGSTPGEYLKGIVERGIAKKFEGSTPQNGGSETSVEAAVTGSTPRWWTREEPLIDKPIWAVKGVKYAEGQKLLAKTPHHGVVTVICPGYDADGNLLSNA